MDSRACSSPASRELIGALPCQERSREANRIQKVRGSQHKVGVGGHRQGADLLPQGPADMRGRLREKLEALEEALLGVVGSHQRFMLATQLRRLSTLLERLDAEVARRVRQHRDVLQVIDTSPAWAVALPRRSWPRWAPTWTGLPSLLGPGSGQVEARSSNASLQSALVEAARAAARTKTYLGAQYHRLARRIGANRAAMAVAHSIAVMLHSIIKNKVPFVDMGHKYFEVRDKTAVTRRAVRQLERLGHKVILQAA